MSLDRSVKRILLIIYLCLYLSIVFVIIFNSKTLADYSDFKSFLTGASIVRSGNGDKLYDLDTQKSTQSSLLDYGYDLTVVLPYLYPPFVAIMFLPLTYLDLGTAFSVYSLIYISFLFLLPIIIGKSFFNCHTRISPFVIILYPLSIHSIILGQTSLFIFALFTITLGLIKRLNYAKAGVFAGMLLFKPQYVIFVPYILLLFKLLDKDFSLKKIIVFSRSFLVVLVTFVALSLLVSQEGVFEYPNFLKTTDQPLYGYNHADGHTLHSFLSMYLDGNYFVEKIIANVFAYFILFTIFSKRLKSLSFGIAASVSVLFVIFTSIHTVDVVLIYIPIILIFEEFILSTGLERAKYGMLILLLILVSLNPLVSLPFHRSILVFVVGVILLFSKNKVNYFTKGAKTAH